MRGSGFYDHIEWDLYDTVEIDCSQDRYDVFSRGLMYKGYSETNSEMANILPAPQSFRINSLIVIPDRCALPESVNVVMSNFSIEIIIGQKRKFQTVLDRFPVNADYKQLYDNKNNQWILPRPVVFERIKPEILIQQYFKCVLWGNDKRGKHEMVRLKVILSGELTLGVQ